MGEIFVASREEFNKLVLLARSQGHNLVINEELRRKWDGRLRLRVWYEVSIRYQVNIATVDDLFVNKQYWRKQILLLKATADLQAVLPDSGSCNETYIRVVLQFI